MISFNLNNILKVILLLNLIIQNISAINNTHHVCYRNETYIELVQIPITQPVRVRSHNWCLDFPPRCSNYKTEIRETIKIQNLTKSRTIEYCCEGYAEIESKNETLCEPICRGGCGRGYCQGPNNCSCDAGYTGRHCTHRCLHGRWGKECKNICKCRNNSICDSATGVCHCNPGWIGESCELPCPESRYGILCLNVCECSSSNCDKKTGECILIENNSSSHHQIVNSINITNLNKKPEENQWISVDATTNYYQNKIIESLNSSLVNLTANIGKLAENLNKTKQESLLNYTTSETPLELIIIKQENLNTNTTNINSSEIQDLLQPIEIIHFIPNINLNETIKAENEKNDFNAIACVSIIFFLLIIAAGIPLFFIYRRLRKENLESKTEDNKNKTDGKLNGKPLPNLPEFSQNLPKIIVPQFYDRPSNNTSINSKKSYNYATESLYSTVSKPRPRNNSLEHLYDEIKYPTANKI